MLLQRWRRWLRAEAPFVLVVAGILAALVYLLIFPNHWRRGSGVLSLALLAGGVMRLTLPSASLGMLTVRGRWRDGLVLLVAGGVVLGVALRLH